jgi:tryptophan synthase alpha chain
MRSVAEHIRAVRASGTPALIAYITAGFPSKQQFLPLLEKISTVADVVEIGVPFTDPMADGTTIQRSSRIALEQKVSLRWILTQLRERKVRASTPVFLMSYLNPLLAYGLDELPEHAAAAGVSGFIVPDLPLEECTELRTALNRQGIHLVQFVTPVTPPARAQQLAAASQGFTYAVTMTGTTGKNVDVPQKVLEFFGNVRQISAVPVCAGFGIRRAEQIAHLAPYVDGVIVGSALIEVLERGEDPVAWLKNLRPGIS